MFKAPLEFQTSIRLENPHHPLTDLPWHSFVVVVLFCFQYWGLNPGRSTQSFEKAALC